MTYLGFLVVFLGIPILILGFFTWIDNIKGRKIPLQFRGLPIWFSILIHILAALIYTTPWDNYLVANRVWYYDPDKIIGLTLGWVPIEEYLFFLAQTLATGLWLRFLLVREKPEKGYDIRFKNRWIVILIPFSIFLISLYWLIIGWMPGSYLGLILSWAIPPILIQLYFGGDILLRNKRFIFTGLAVPTIYLSLADSFAISKGIWEINPDLSTNIFLGGILPVEEFIFFLVTNLLISFGICLFLSIRSHERMRMKYPKWPIKFQSKDGLVEYD